MRVFVSSSFEDLREHRAAAIRVLRQLGHEVLAMEDMIAGSVAPLPKVLDMVDRSEAYVGIFAWRYGYVPSAPPPGPSPANFVAVSGAVAGKTSITHYEYLRAVERKLPILAFLLDESCPWPPRLVDGFDAGGSFGRGNVEEIRKLRFTLQQERVVSWFTTPADLEARVSAAITTAGLTRNLDLQPATALSGAAGSGDSTAESGIVDAIRRAGDQRALKIDLSSTWWSTRLYLIAALAERLTNVRRILIVNSGGPAAQRIAPAPGGVVMGSGIGSGIAMSPPGGMAMGTDHEEFIGMISTNSILATLRQRIPAVEPFEAHLRERPAGFSALEVEISELVQEWRSTFGEGRPAASPPPVGGPPPPAKEALVKVDLSADLLRRWFADAMLREPIRISDLQRASVVDLLRLLDYPSDFVPVVTRKQAEGTSTAERVDVLDKTALNARLARSYLVELMDRARIS
jgi:hypothetical protein